jgi:non-specific protein-tyrosine kinase
LERAKEARAESSLSDVFEGKRQQPLEKSDKTGTDHALREIRVNYSRTKVLNINPRKLKENKIFSHTKEDGMTEQISILKTQLLNKLEQINGNTLMVTSAYPGEGKTFMSINLAFSIAQELHRTVLLVDCDLRHPDAGHVDFASDYFGVTIDKGLTDYLLGQVALEDILLNPGIDRMTICPGGRPILNSLELLSSSRMEMLVKEMKQRYGKNRIVIFDSPSILKISDPLAFSRFVDGILLVVETNRSSTADIKKVMSLLRDRVILGTILNKVKSG